MRLWTDITTLTATTTEPNSAARDDFWHDKGSFTGCLHDVTKKLTSSSYLFSTLFNSNRLCSGRKMRRGCCSKLGGCLLRSFSGEPTCIYIFVYSSSFCLADWYLFISSFKFSYSDSFWTCSVSPSQKLFWILLVWRCCLNVSRGAERKVFRL